MNIKIQKLFQEIKSILADIKIGDVMNIYTAVWALIYGGAILYSIQKSVAPILIVIFIILSPLPIIILSVVTRLILNRLLNGIQEDSEESEIIITLSEEGEFEYKDGNMYKVARMEIFNNTETEITKCYATLQSADDVLGEERKIALIPSLGNFHKPDKIRWNEDKDMSERCEIKIPIKDARYIDLADTLGTFHYNLCENDVDANWMSGSVLHTFKIRIDYFNGTTSKFKKLEGYIYSAYLQDARETFVKNGRIKKQSEIQKDQIEYLKMIFKEGSWEQDKEVREYLGLKN